MQIIKALIGKPGTQTGKVSGYTATGKLLVSGANGQDQAVRNLTGRTLGIGASVNVSNAGADRGITGASGFRGTVKKVTIRG